MNIDASPASSLARTSRTESSTRTVGGSRGKPQSSTDQVRLSLLSDAIRTATPGSAGSTAHAAQVGQVVSSGAYRVDPSVLSEDLIRHSMAAAA